MEDNVIQFPTTFQGVRKCEPLDDTVCQCPMEWVDEWSGELMWDVSDICSQCGKER